MNFRLQVLLVAGPLDPFSCLGLHPFCGDSREPEPREFFFFFFFWGGGGLGSLGVLGLRVGSFSGGGRGGWRRLGFVLGLCLLRILGHLGLGGFRVLGVVLLFAGCWGAFRI